MGGFLPRLAGAGLALKFYFLKCIFPVELLPIYPRWTVNPPSPVQFLPWLVIMAALWGLWTRRAGWGRHVLFGCGCFLVNLAPVLGFITISYQRITGVADHFVYLPLLGLAALAAAGADALRARLAAPLRGCACGGMVLIVGLLALQSHRHAEHFRDEETLWTGTVQRNPAAWMGHNNLGDVFSRTGRIPEAIVHYEIALRLKPNFPEAQYNLGNALVQIGRLPEAVPHYEEALRLSPDSTKVRYNLANAQVRLGRLPEAIANYEKALQTRYDLAVVHYNLGYTLLRAGRGREAIGHFEAVLRFKPRSYDAHTQLGIALAQEGRLTEAIGHFQEAVRIKPADAGAHNVLGGAFAQAGRLSEAREQFEQALRIRPDYADACANLARLQALQQGAR